ncbi:hypothetical protein KCV03_g514, partial [Aureobasidium melanogenum]
MLLPIKHNLQHALRHHSKRVNYKHTLYNLRPSVASQPAANILIHLSHRDAMHKAMERQRDETNRKLQAVETRVLKGISEMEINILSAMSKISNDTEAQQQSSQKEELQVDVKFWGFVRGRVRVTGEQEESQVVKQEQI